MNLETLVLPLKSEDNAFKASISRVTQLVEGAIDVMEKMVDATFQWADELDGLQDVMGVTNKTAAALNFTLRKSGVATDTLAKGMTILEKGLVKADGTLDMTGKKLKDFGINALDANGAVKDQGVLLDEIAAKYDTFSTQQERVNFLTDVFGRSGAELIDFFDTLASEGGIDSVTKKVEALGLAIDPARYETFSRSLEELKLIGLGMAVSFTEQIMPALEGFLGILTDPNLSFAQKIQQIGTSAGEFVSTWYNSLKTWLAAIDWNKVSTDIAGFINSIDWAKAGFNFANFITEVGNGIIKFGQAFDWKSVGNAIASAFNNFWAGMFGMTEGEVQYRIKAVLNKISQEITDWTNNFHAWLAGFGIGSGKMMTAPQFDLSSYGSNPSFSGPGGSGGGVQAGNYSYSNGVYTLNRASGGPMIAGQDYNIVEFFRPEKFTPSVNGRMDPITGGEVTANMDEERLARVLLSVLQPLLA